jgi:hypothetical protein
MPAVILLGAALLLFAPMWLAGKTPFWGDMTYIHHPWQSLAAQYLQSGHAPLWDPYLYFGMPMAANMQRAVFYPGQGPFFLFGFADGAALFHLAHYWLSGWLTFLWLRSLRASKPAALCGALLFAFSGGMISRMPFLNHLSTLSLVPALFLFFRRPLALALTLCLAFLAGYPPFLAGSVALCWGVMLLLSRPDALKTWAGAGALAMALGAVQLIPGMELMSLSRRSSGVLLEEMLKFGYAPSDLAQWISPLLVKNFNAAVEWWKCSYLGFAGFALAGLGLMRTRRLAPLVLLVTLIILGDSNPVSRWLWENVTPLHFVRYPGNLGYLGLPLASLLCAVAVQNLGRRGRVLAVLAVFAELFWTAQGLTPLAPRSLFTTPGGTVRRLQESLDGRRYLLSPLALETHAGKDVVDWKTRLYGMTNAPFRLRAAGNFGEPLVPRRNYELMDHLYRQPSLEKALELLPQAGISVLLGPGGDPWRFMSVDSPGAMAAWPREDRFRILGEGEGVAHVREPRYPGWKAWLNGSAVQTESDFIAFQKIRVPKGSWRLDFKYEPWTWTAGLWLTLLAALAFGAACYNRLCAAPISR